MKHSPTHFQDLDLLSTIRPIPLIDIYSPYYPDPDFSFDPYWDIQIYNQHHLHFYQEFTKNPMDIEPDQPEIDQHLKAILSAAFVDPWQHTRADIHPPTQGDIAEELPQNGPLVTLTVTVEERFANTLISRHGEPDYVPLLSQT